MRLLLVFCVLLTGCVSTNVKYEFKQSAGLKDDVKGTTFTTDVTFTETW